MKYASILALLLLMTVGCSSQRGELVFRDQAGRTLATGQIDFPDTLPESGQTFEGAWHLRSAVPDFPAPAPAGRFTGIVRDQEFTLNLNPTFRDNNLILNGAMTPRTLQGVWTHTTFTGPRESGAFTIRRPQK